MAAGRPPELTPKLLQEILHILPTCLYLETAAAFCGVDSRSYRRWLQRGRKEQNRLESPENEPKPAEAIYVELLQGAQKAMAQGEILDLRVIRTAAQGIVAPNGEVVVAPQWPAAAWRLERRFPDKWGRDTRRIRELEKRAELLEKKLLALQLERA